VSTICNGFDYCSNKRRSASPSLCPLSLSPTSALISAESFSNSFLVSFCSCLSSIGCVFDGFASLSIFLESSRWWVQGVATNRVHCASAGSSISPDINATA